MQHPLYTYWNWFLHASKLLEAVEKLATARETASVLSAIPLAWRPVIAVSPPTSRYTYDAPYRCLIAYRFLTCGPFLWKLGAFWCPFFFSGAL